MKRPRLETRPVSLTRRPTAALGAASPRHIRATSDYGTDTRSRRHYSGEPAPAATRAKEPRETR
jgi:hypothetical protein